MMMLKGTIRHSMIHAKSLLRPMGHGLPTSQAMSKMLVLRIGAALDIVLEIPVVSICNGMFVMTSFIVATCSPCSPPDPLSPFVECNLLAEAIHPGNLESRFEERAN
jgi:hypothetical protein